jgi:uncharacterized protein YidB (DUF937 family)
MGFLDNLIKKVAPSLGGNADLLNNLTQHLNLGEGGGLANLVKTFQNKGLGDIVNSWVSTGKNLPVSPDQIQKALGPDTIKNLAGKLGLSTSDATSRLSSLLPSLVDKLTPDGKLPGATPSSGGTQGGMTDLLGNLTRHLNLGEAGGLANLVKTFQNKGLGDIVNSWVSTGKNLPISPDQIQKGLGSDTIKNLAGKLGLSHTDAAAKLTSLLPGLVDKLTPNGKLPE